MPVSSGSGGRYVPPHLRGKGGSGGGKNSAADSGPARKSPGSGNGSGSSRWNNLDHGSSGDYNRHGNGPRTGGRNSNLNSNSNPSPGNYNNNNNNNAGTSTGTGTATSRRWANVDRSAVASGNHGTRYNDNRTSHNNNNNNINGRNRRRNFDEDHHDKNLAHARAIFFGDSFIKLFGLLSEYTDSILKTPRTIEVQKYKAASAKGLCREGNENRAKILRTVESIRLRRQNQNQSRHPNRVDKKAYQNVERLVFCFGSVDVHMSFYYKKYVEEKPLSDDDLRAIANNYVDFVEGLDTGIQSSDSEGEAKTLPKLIVGIYPSPLCDKDVGASLQAYGSLETKDQVATVDASDDKSIESRQARVDLFNRALRERCELHNANRDVNDKSNGHGILEYWDVQSELLTHDEDGRPKVRDAYKDVSDLNIHLIHETTLQLWVQKWPWYEALTTSGNVHDNNNGNGNSNGSIGFLEYLQKTFDEYRKTKPWAERTHVAETRGVRLA